MRWTMLPPILPSPTKPICIWLSSLLSSPVILLAEIPRRPATGSPSSLTRSAGRPCVAQRLQVARRLCRDQRPERVAGVGDLDVAPSDRRRAAGSGRSAGRPCAAVPSSAGSAGRTRTWWPRPVAARIASRSSAIAASNSSDGRHVAHDRHVVRRARVGQQRAQLLVAGGLELGDRAGVEHPLGVVLGLLHVRLVERVDLERPAGHRDRELGQEEDPAEVGGPVCGKRERRMPGIAQTLSTAWSSCSSGFSSIAQVGEHAVVSVDVGRRPPARRPRAGCRGPACRSTRRPAARPTGRSSRSGRETTKVSLSRPCRASSPSAAPSHSPEFDSLES